MEDEYTQPRIEKGISVALLIDPMGSSMQTPEQEVEHLDYVAKAIYGDLTTTRVIQHISQVSPAEKVVFFDYGGMGMGLGNSMLDDMSRACIDWAQSNPSKLIIAESSYTWGHSLKLEMEDKGLMLPNVVGKNLGQDWDFILEKLPEHFQADFCTDLATVKERLMWNVPCRNFKDRPKPYDTYPVDGD